MCNLGNEKGSLVDPSFLALLSPSHQREGGVEVMVT